MAIEASSNLRSSVKQAALHRSHRLASASNIAYASRVQRQPLGLRSTRAAKPPLHHSLVESQRNAKLTASLRPKS